MKIYTDKRLLSSGFVGGTLSRHPGNMREADCQSAVYQTLGIAPERILHFHQVHGDTILSVPSSEAARAHATKPLPDADAWVFSPMPAGWGAAILTADCVPLFLWTEDGNSAALAHCGWRGVVQGLPGKTARALLQVTRASHAEAWLGPHIQSCCFEVQEDVAAQFPADCKITETGNCLLI